MSDFNTNQDGHDYKFKVELRSSNAPTDPNGTRRPSYGRRRSRPPSQYNGIHRRRKKRATR